MIIAASFEWAAEAEFFETPFAVIEFCEGGKGRDEFFAVFVVSAMYDLFLKGPVKAFYDAVCFGFADQGKAGSEAVEAALALEVVG